jgi:hypothetical protein
MFRHSRSVVIGGTMLTVLAGVVAAAVLGFPHEPTAGAGPRAIELPEDFRTILSNLCFADEFAGIDAASSQPDGSSGVPSLQFGVGGSGAAFTVRIESVGDWSVSVTSAGATMRNERPSMSAADAARMSFVASVVIPDAVSFYHCLSPFRFATRNVPPPPTSSSQLLQLYRYDNAVLWPCLTSRGIDMGDPPSRDQFVNSFAALTADPFSAMTPTRKMLPRLGAALEACPLRPAYLD